MILEEETYKKFGYYPSDLSRRSGKRILAACDKCGKTREFPKADYSALCRICAQKGKGKRVQRICETCGNIFYTYISRVEQERGKFCSRKCAGIARSKKYIGENHPNWQDGLIKCKCEWCGKSFTAHKCYVKKGKGKYCSKDCMNKARVGKYRGKNSPSYTRMKQICRICGKPFYAKVSRIKEGKAQYCSKTCGYVGLSERMSGKNHPNWLGGRSIKYCSKWNEYFREYIRNKFGRKCFLCGKTEEENGQKLSVHHVSYNKNCGCAKTEEDTKADDETCQFVPLCVSCHSKTHTNREFWESTLKKKMRNTLKGWYI